jgi:hypothetical protein
LSFGLEGLGWNLLQQGVKTPAIIVTNFSMDIELAYRNDVERLLQDLGCTHNPEEW